MEPEPNAAQLPADRGEHDQEPEPDDSPVEAEALEEPDQDVATEVGCARCGSTKLIRDVSLADRDGSSDEKLEIVVFGNPEALIFKNRLTGEIRADICGVCGHIEFRVANPEQLYRHYERARGLDRPASRTGLYAAPCVRCGMLVVSGSSCVPVVYNSNGYDSVEALRQIRGLVDIYLPDIKYLDNRIGKQFSLVDDYADIVPDVLGEMLNQAGSLELDNAGIAMRGLLVRHLILPGQLDNSRNCLRFLADLSSDIHIRIMSQYSPQYKAGAYPGIHRTLREDEYDEITDYALDLGLKNAFIQELNSQDHYLPDFDRKRPFNSTY